jgi:hypothetical protein
MAVVMPPSGLTVGWEEDSAATPDLVLRKADGSPWPGDKFTSSYSSVTNTTVVSGPDVIDNIDVNIGARPKPAAGVIGLFAQITGFAIALLPTLSIANTSYLDESTNTLHLDWSWSVKDSITIADTFSARLLPQNSIVPLDASRTTRGTTTTTPGAV